MFHCMLLFDYHFLPPNIIPIFCILIPNFYLIYWMRTNINRKVILSSNLWALLNHPSISVHILHILIKQRKKKTRIYEYIKKKSDSVNLGKICNTACYMTNWQHQCLFNNPCLLYVTRTSSRAEWFMLISCLKQLCMGGSWAHSLKCCRAENKSFAYNYIKL